VIRIGNQKTQNEDLRILDKLFAKLNKVSKNKQFIGITPKINHRENPKYQIQDIESF